MSSKTLGNTFALLCAVLFLLAPGLDPNAQDLSFSTLAGGVKARTLSAGSGPVAEPGMVATIHFIGWIDEQGQRGPEFFNSRKEGDAVSFVIGADKVMPAWNVGVTGMQVGERRMLLIPPAMGFGDRGVQGRVPPDSPLMLQVELVRLTGDDAS